MKRTLCVLFVMGCAVNAYAQQKKEAPKEGSSKEVTNVKTTTTTVASEVDLLGGETFNVIDASVMKLNTLDLRLSGRWVESDEWIVQPEIVWGAIENFEFFLTVPTWVDGEPYEGNYDTYLGGQWRFREQQDYWPMMALGTSIRIPTGEGSNGVDAELRLSLTNEYDNGLRSHLNFFGTTVNTDNVVEEDTDNEDSWDAEVRDFQYGAVVGLDGPLCADGAVRWVVDYMYRISKMEGGGGMNIGEAGVQWQIADAHKLGFSVQAGLDHAEDSTPNVGAALTYAYTIAW